MAGTEANWPGVPTLCQSRDSLIPVWNGCLPGPAAWWEMETFYLNKGALDGPCPLHPDPRAWEWGEKALPPGVKIMRGAASL